MNNNFLNNQLSFNKKIPKWKQLSIRNQVPSVSDIVPSVSDNVQNVQEQFNRKIPKWKKLFLKNQVSATEAQVIDSMPPKERFRVICEENIPYIRNIDLPVITKNNPLEAVLIEYRCFPHLEFLVRNAILKLGDKWSHTVVCGNLNYDFMVAMCANISPEITVIKTDYDNLNQSTYSELLANKSFWEMFSGEKILLYQEDSCIFKSNIDDFLQWDYIGAPWPKSQNDTPNCVGNGGFSLRTTQCMIDVIDKVSIQDTNIASSTSDYMRNNGMTVCPEDVYFSKNMQHYGIGRVADWDSAFAFSSESVYNRDSFGGHCIWNGCIKWEREVLTKIKRVTLQNYKMLFHKYNLNISDQYKEIFYECIKKNETNNDYICHYHIYDLNNYSYNELTSLIEHFDVVVTFCKGDCEKIMNYSLTLIKVNNTGYDIGGKLVALEYLKRNKINYNYILFLHSKSNHNVRQKYFDPLIKNVYRIKLIKQLITEPDLYGIFPNCIYYSENNINAYEYDKLYYNDFLNYLNIKEYKVFSEGNCFICKKYLLDYIFDDNYKLFYNILNTENSFDANWFKIYYNYDNHSNEECFYKYTNENLYGNNILLHEKKDSLPDGMIEHVFERIWINVIKCLNKKYLILDKNNAIPFYDIKINAIYFPQFHEIDENNTFWGKGFTEWTLLKPFCSPQNISDKKYEILKPHEDIGYYNLEYKDTLSKQISIAESYNINGFVIYHYWFNSNKKILYKPLEYFLDANITFPFCISWANETWSKRWDGSSKEVLIQQEYSNNKEENIKHINYLIQFFKMPNYIKNNNNECIFYVYNFKDLINNYYNIMECWNEELDKHNIKIKIVITENSFRENHDIKIENVKSFLFEPMYSSNHVNLFKQNTNIDFDCPTFSNDFDIEHYKKYNSDLQLLSDYELISHFKLHGHKECRNFKYKNNMYNNMRVDYNEIIDNYNNNKYDTTNKHLGLPLYWNNMVRRKNLPFLYVDNFNSRNLEQMLIILLSKIILRSCNTYDLKCIDKNDNVINVNAWNEWNEQAVLEPNNITGYENLETISKIIQFI